MAIVRIERGDDPRLAAYADLAQPDQLGRRGRFAAEGRLVVERLLASRRYGVESLLLNEASLSSLSPLLSTLDASVPIYVCPPPLLVELTGHHFHRGCLALVRRPAPTLLADLLGTARSLVILEGVGNADNVGSVFRNAAAFGVDGVLLGPGCLDPLYRKAIRTSMAQTLLVPYVMLGKAPALWLECLERLRELAFQLVALTPREPSTDIARFVLPASTRFALLVGAEGSGLSDALLGRAEHRVRIAMRPEVDSLNLGVATGIALHRLTGAPGQDSPLAFDAAH
jgi:tRNA G18 (ribose-2'-O)-methylase SpoU